MKYTIKIFPNDPATTDDLDATYQVEGIPCEAFAIFAMDNDDGCVTCYQGTALIDLGQAINSDDMAMAAAHIAVGIEAAERSINDREASSKLKRLLSRALGSEEADDDD